MRKYRVCFLCFGLAMCVAGFASAQILEEKAGADFNYFYTGADLVGHADWAASGTPGLAQVEGTQLRYSPNPSGWDSFQWNNVPSLSHETGWTMEFTFQITQEGTDASFPFGAIVSDGTAGEYNILYFDAGAVEYRDTPRGTQVYRRDYTDAMHTVRFAEPAGGGTGNTSLWIDDVLMANNLTGFNYTLARCYLGKATAAQVDGEILIDGIAIDTTGAYSPVGQIIPTPPSAEDLTEAASDTFAYKYEMDLDPTNPAEIDLDSNGMADFEWVIAGNATYEFTPQNTWVVNSPDQGDQCYMDGGIGSETTLWRAGEFTGENGYTIEVRMKVLSQSEDATQVFSIASAPQDSNEIGAIIVNQSETQGYGAGALDDSDNSDDFHVFRLVRDKMAVPGFPSRSAYWIWRDGVLVTEEAFSNNHAIVRDALYFGDMSGSAGGSFEVDYVRFTEGMYAPVGWTYPPADDLPGDLNGDGMVGSADLDIVRANWGATVTAGDLTMGDPSGDGVVGSADLDIVRANWGATAAAAVPEPGALTLALFGLLAVLATRRR